MKLSIIIPICYDDKLNLESTISFLEEIILPKQVSNRELILFDYNSTIEYWNLPDIIKRNKNIIYYDCNQINIKNIQTAIRMVSGDFVMIYRVFENWNSNTFRILLEPLIEDKADVVFGTKYFGSKSLNNLNLLCKLYHKLITWFNWKMSGIRLTDSETYYRIFRKKIFDRFKLIENGFGVEFELTAKVADLVKAENLRIYEVNISDAVNSNINKCFKPIKIYQFIYFTLKYNSTKIARFIRYCMMGIIVALTQLITISIFIEKCQLNNYLGENIANFISIEISLIMAFFLHRYFSWRKNVEHLLKQLITFHLVSLISVLLRIVIFGILSMLRVPYLFNSVIGILIAVLINFLGYDRFVFYDERKGNT